LRTGQKSDAPAFVRESLRKYSESLDKQDTGSGNIDLHFADIHTVLTPNVHVS
jgi:hypothetical protein